LFKKILLSSLLFLNISNYLTACGANQNPYQNNNLIKILSVCINWYFLSPRENDSRYSQILRAGGQFGIANWFNSNDPNEQSLSLLGGTSAILIGNLINPCSFKKSMAGSMQDVILTVRPFAIAGALQSGGVAFFAKNQKETTDAVYTLMGYALLFGVGKIIVDRTNGYFAVDHK
jgi:hypothetical protein